MFYATLWVEHTDANQASSGRASYLQHFSKFGFCRELTCDSDDQFGRNNCSISHAKLRVSLYLYDFIEQATAQTFAHRTQNNRKRMINSCLISPDEQLQNLVNPTTGANIPGIPNTVVAISTMTCKVISKILVASIILTIGSGSNKDCDCGPRESNSPKIQASLEPVGSSV